MNDDEVYAYLRSIAATFRQSATETESILSPELRSVTPDWLLERVDEAIRSMAIAAIEVGRFIREDRDMGGGSAGDVSAEVR